MSNKTGQNNVPFSSTQKIINFLEKKYPNSYLAKEISKILNIKLSTTRRTLSRLAKDNKSGIRRLDKGVYIANVTAKNFQRIEQPILKFHNITIHYILIKETKKGGSPPALNTKETSKNITQNTKHFIWNYQNCPYKVTVQLNPNNTITVHLKASKNPIDQIGFRDFLQWINGLLTGKNIDHIKYKLTTVKIEINKDYRRVTITPTSLEIEELLEKSFLRIYQKYSNLTRVECRLTLNGEKQIYQLFKDFTTLDSQKSNKPDEFIDVV